MKQLPWILLIIIIAIAAYLLFNKPKTTTLLNTTQPNPSNASSIYAAGLALINLISATKCGKNGNPPCTVQDLQNAGWTPEQIAAAQEASQTTSSVYLCQMYGINCP